MSSEKSNQKKAGRKKENEIMQRENFHIHTKKLADLISFEEKTTGVPKSVIFNRRLLESYKVSPIKTK